MARLRNWMAEARRLEAAGDLQGAIAIFRKALVAQEETTGFADLSVQNGLGDLYLRVGRPDAAIEAYEQAARQCEEQQLYANGIALCKKILRNAPAHAPTYRRAARLCALSGLEADALRHLTKHRELSEAEGDRSAGLAALAEIAEITADEESSLELADALAAHGRQREALERLRAVRDRRQAQGRGVVPLLRRIQELQQEIDPARPPLESDEEPTPPAADAHRAGSGRRDESPAADRGDADEGRREQLEELAESLRATLAGEDEERREKALEITDRMLRLDPDRVDLLLRKLELAFELGDEPVVTRAFLSLGECLDRKLESFTVRMLSASTDAGAVTAAIGVEGRGEAGRRS